MIPTPERITVTGLLRDLQTLEDNVAEKKDWEFFRANADRFAMIHKTINRALRECYPNLQEVPGIRHLLTLPEEISKQTFRQIALLRQQFHSRLHLLEDGLSGHALLPTETRRPLSISFSNVKAVG